MNKKELIYRVVNETEDYKKTRKLIDDVVSRAVLQHTETYKTVYGFPVDGHEFIFNELIKEGIYNGKTCTFKTPMGTITYAPKVGASND